jgi:hypothetical protein
MRREDNHLSDEDLLLAADGELAAADTARVQSHLAACWSCRTRNQELVEAVVDFVHAYRGTMNTRLPSGDGPRALLKARIYELARSQPDGWHAWFRDTKWRWSFTAMLAAGVALVAYFVYPAVLPQRVRAATVTVPDPSLTPGATVFVGREQVCRASNTKNKGVSGAVQRKVFEEYGIRPAEPRAYEVDYLITPALGGADDIHNLWPESSGSTVWNAQVKDALEDHLRDLVCSGQLELATAQHEIAVNWIEAYKKYFHTDRPINGR